MNQDTLHLTLLFLGNIPVESVSRLLQAASLVRVAQLRLEIDRIDGWQHNAISYAAPTKKPDGLQNLANQLREHVAKAGFRVERKLYMPHLTLLRNVVRVPTSQSITPVIWEAQEFCLLRSAPDQYGAHYEVLESWRLLPP